MKVALVGIGKIALEAVPASFGAMRRDGERLMETASVLR